MTRHAPNATWKLLGLTVSALLLGAGCGMSQFEEGNVHAAYGEDQQTLIVVQRADVFYRLRGSALNADARCVLLDGTCVVVATGGDWCEPDNGPADLIVVDGEVIQSVCYPTAGNGTVVTLGDDGPEPGDLDVPQTASGSAFTFHPDTDGEPLVGDVVIDGNQVSLYGNGPDRTIIDGDLYVRGNGTRVRGVHVTGDVIVERNRASIILSEVEGDIRFVERSTNGGIVAATVVLGSITAPSNNLLVVDNDVQGEIALSGNNQTCVSNHGFDDEDGDGHVDADEPVEAIGCAP